MRLICGVGASEAPAGQPTGPGDVDDERTRSKAAVAAAAHATDQGLLVQWRSHWSNQPSRQLERALGLVHCGRQFSFEVGAA